MPEEFNKHLVVKVEALEEEVFRLRRMLFGKKSEKLEPKEEQGEIAFEEEEQEATSPPTEPTPSHPADSKPADTQKKQRLFKELAKRSLDTQNPPRNKLKDAIDYAQKRQTQLCSWLENACIPIDNNQVERAIRPVTVGRKNSLFIGSPEAGQRAAIIYTMVEECKRTGTDFLQWLTEVLRRLPTHRASEGYLALMPGILKLSTENPQHRKVSL